MVHRVLYGQSHPIYMRFGQATANTRISLGELKTSSHMRGMF